MKIKVGKYVIESNGRCYEVYRPVASKKTNRINKGNVQYYVTIESMLRCLPERMAMTESNASTLEELLRDVRSYHQLIEANCNERVSIEG